MKDSIVKRVGERVGHNKLFKDKNFTAEDWALHKSWLRFLPQISISMRVLFGFALPVGFFTVWAVFLCLYHVWLVDEGAPDFWNHNTNLYQAFNLSSFCLSLLLVHRTTATYNRWWAARITWGQILNIVRNLVRLCASTMGFQSENRPLLEMLARHTIAMPYLLRAHLNNESAKNEIESVLLPHELDFILSSTQPCLRAAQVVSNIVGRGLPGPEHQQTRAYIDQQIQLYVNDVGACERIYKTPVPFAFTRHLDRFLMIWLFFLPFALWPIAGWASPVAEFLLAYLLMGTENIGVQIEEPFCVMPLSVFCAGCEASVVEIMESYLGAESIVDEEISKGESRGFKRHSGIPLAPDPEDEFPPTPRFPVSPSQAFRSFTKFSKKIKTNPNDARFGSREGESSPDSFKLVQKSSKKSLNALSNGNSTNLEKEKSGAWSQV